MSGNVTVYGRNVLRPPLCDDPDAQMVVIRNTAGAPIILLVRLSGDTWGLSTPEDTDWAETCIRFGITPPRPMAEVIAAASAKPH